MREPIGVVGPKCTKGIWQGFISKLLHKLGSKYSTGNKC